MYSKPMEDNLLKEVLSHYNAWTIDRDQRLTREGGWNEITDAYYGKLPDDWPFISRTTDPRIRTAIIEKNARLVSGRLRGRLVPRETGDVLGARINNSIIDFQWDTANDGGSMATKLSICDLDTRLYQSKFGLVKWRYEIDKNGKVLFCGNEMYPLDIRDCGWDFNMTHIRDAKWFQHSSWEYLEDLDKQSDTNGKPIFKNLGEIKAQLSKKNLKSNNNKGQIKSNKYTSRVKELRDLQDRVGTDIAFPVIEVVTEYRRDRWITFCPDYNVIIRDIPNPYKHGKIPIAQLRYYPLQDDPLGESEVEPVIPLWKAIQATVCGFMDEVMLKMRPPLKIIEGRVRIETIVYAPEAQWIMNSPDAVTEMQSAGEAIRYFQASYSALVSAFNTAMGMLSQGTSNVDPLSADKTATEIKYTAKQQNARDDKNQQDLIEFIKDIIMMWLSNNQQFLFRDPQKKEYVHRIIGNDNFEYFKRAGLDEMYVPDEAMTMLGDIIKMTPEMGDAELANLYESAKIPKYPIYENPGEENPEKIRLKPKMKVNDMGDGAEITVVPEDLEGDFDYVADVRSMSMGADAEMAAARQEALQFVTSSPSVLQLLAQEGWKPKIKELLVTNFEDKGLRDSERFFEKIQNEQNVNPNPNQQMGGIGQIGQNAGVQQVPQTNPTGGIQQSMVGPQPIGQG